MLSLDGNEIIEVKKSSSDFNKPNVFAQALEESEDSDIEDVEVTEMKDLFD